MHILINCVFITLKPFPIKKGKKKKQLKPLMIHMVCLSIYIYKIAKPRNNMQRYAEIGQYRNILFQ